ncbi:MAG: 3-dehydroquinate synthase II [Desulfobacteraceae bacterium]|nr:3-dehydroquinate synthase II [Desulfobacteraceae bacterium]
MREENLKEAWVRMREWSKEAVTAALEGGADVLIVPAGWQDRIKALGRIATAGPDGDLRPGKDVFFESLDSPEDEARIAGLLQKGPVVLIEKTEEDEARRPWEIIPLENLVARGGRLIVPASSASDLELALGVLEKGVAGVVIDCPDAAQIRKMLSLVKAVPEREALSEAIIEAVRPVGIGDRVCVDTCTLMEEGEGLLVGNSSGFLVLVQAEAKVNPYVAPRPFRVNAGPVHAYTRVPGGGTRYLSELRAGDPVLVVRARGEAQPATVGRVKIERRPLLLIEARCGDIRGSIILQNAETIRLTAPDGEARSVVDLRPGDPVLAAIEPAGRHFGMKVDETIREH